MTHAEVAARAIRPNINLNGSSPDRLEESLRTCCEAAQGLQEAMSAAWPHGRDYQGLETGFYAAALSIAEARMDCVRAIIDGLRRDVDHLIGERVRVGR